MTTENENIVLNPQGTTTPTVAPEDETNGTATATATIPTTVVTEEEEQDPQMLEGIVADCVKLNVRKAPAANAPIVCTIPRDTEVVVFEEESTEEFYKIYTASGIEGFCMKQYIAVNP